MKVDAFILAGGLSSRMGRDKGRARLGRRTLTSHVKATVQRLGLKVRLIRKDSVERCGPIGGIFTALKRSEADCVLVLACDMPFVSEAFLRMLIGSSRASDNAVFAVHNRQAGFPLLMRRAACLPVVERQIDGRDLSLQALAKVLRARLLRPTRGQTQQLTNINTPGDLKAAHELKCAL